jgi:4-amino-4-deoxy-L-arabinose transferase-like glycosyltransferase
MKRLLELVQKYADWLIAAALFVGYSGALLATAGSLGFMRDEGFYFAAARSYDAWFEQLLQSPAQALTPAVVDRYWSVNHEHPSLIKALFALSHRFLAELFSETSTSFRLPGMLLSSLAVAVTFLWGRRVKGRAAGLVAALSFALMPRVFFHAHLACFDLPVSALWLVTSYAYVRSLTSTRRAWVVAAGVLYGLLLDTKHNSWIFPFALAAHFALTQAVPLWRDLQQKRPFWRRFPPAWLSMLLLGPVVFYALWPWLWRDTLPRLQEYVRFHTGHEYYNMEFLGRTYFEPPMPLGYAWLMTAATVPLVTLALSAIGAVAALQNARSSQGPHRSDYAFWAVSLLMSYAPWLSPNTPIFGGTKHWMTAYPFLCLFAGLGFVRVCQALAAVAPLLSRPAIVAACVLVGPLVMTAHAHPFGLSAYTPLVGGAPGAASLGLNRTFWGYTTQSLAPFINQQAPKRGTVYVHDTALQSFAMFQEDGRLRRDLRGSLNIAASDIALYHHEPHMSRVEQQIWANYGSTSPDAIAAFDGVPIAWSYARTKPPKPRAEPAKPRPDTPKPSLDRGKPPPEPTQ